MKIIASLVFSFLIIQSIHAHSPGSSTFQMFCNEGYGDQYSGSININRNSVLSGVLSGLKSKTNFSCKVNCSGSDYSFNILDCGKTNSNGDISFKRNLIFPANQICSAPSINLSSLNNNISCETALAAGACRRKRNVKNGVVIVSCRKFGCKQSCNVIRYGAENPEEGTDTGKSSAICDEDLGEVCTCSCR